MSEYFGEDRNLTPEGVRKVKAWYAEELAREFSPEELAWMRAEEKKMTGECPNSLYLDGITLEPDSCEQHHCPVRFDCLTYMKRVETWPR